MKKIAIVLFAVAALAAGCKKFTDINNNPNQPTFVTPNVVLSAALQGSGAQLAGGFFQTTRWMGSMARSGNFIQTIPTETYSIAADFADGDFQALYSVLGRYNYIEHNSNGDPFYVGVGKTMKAFHFAMVVDGFNNVPYSQAFNLAKYPNPKYDDAASIYADLITQLDSAVIEFGAAKAFYVTSPGTVRINDDKYDIMFGRGAGGSDIAAADARLLVWIRFANTVKLKLLMNERLVVTPAYIHAELAKVTANGQGYITAGESAAVNPGYTKSSAAQQNPFYGAFINTSGNPTNTASFFRANQYFINFCTKTGDDRKTDVYSTVGGNQVGNFDGDPNALTNTFTSTLGPGVLQSDSQDELLLSDFESLFIQAEAVQLGFTEVSGSSAAALTRTATEQSYVYLNDNGDGNAAASAANGDAFLDGDTGDAKTDVSVSGLQAIMTLKWAALVCINWEQSYTDYRRTGFPKPDGTTFGFSLANNVIHHTNPTTGLTVNFPYRYLYPQSEINTNGKNIPAGTNAYTAVFWDTQEK